MHSPPESGPVFSKLLKHVRNRVRGSIKHVGFSQCIISTGADDNMRGACWEIFKLTENVPGNRAIDCQSGHLPFVRHELTHLFGHVRPATYIRLVINYKIAEQCNMRHVSSHWT